ASVPDAEIDAYIEEFNANFTPAAEAEEETGPADQFIEAGGRRRRYARQGEGGATVLLIHGFGGDLDNWLFNIQALAEHHTVYALDLPGHGQSDKTVDEPSLAGLAASVQAFMDAVGIDRAHLVGHSLGGAVALQLARERPESVESLALIGSAGLGPEINRGYIDGFVAANSRRELKPHARQLFADPGLVTRQLLEDLLKFKRLDGVDRALRSLAEGLFDGERQRERSGEGFDPGGRPLLVVWGREDAIIPAAHAEHAPAGARVEIIDSAGHMVQMEAANRVNALLLEHLGR
ncbi:MAG: acetoin dehydrogenase dihydrolipoyllysine-residue acetyltransferase subunit, partial [Candidatus Competibacterales bacterium]|nr:acetoin dehydrogenase dihydrolipoyllysine-residue acetyltransferase subunit [Candidatus Competibacterales bacterium]